MNTEHIQKISIESILKGLKNTDTQVLRDTAFAAADAGLLESVEFLCPLIFNSNVGVQEAAEYAIRKLRGKNAVRYLIPYLRNENVTIRNISMDILREIGIDDLAYLQQFMRDEDTNIRIYITDILGYTNDRSVVNILANALLNDKDTNVRYYAAISLGLLAFPECIEPLDKAMQDEEWVQFAVVESLTKIHDKSTIDTLIKALSTSTELVASTIINALGEIGNIKTIPLLFKSLETASTPLRRKAVKAIIQILGEKSLPLLSIKDRDRLKSYLLDALCAEDENIQLAALSGLAVMGDEKVTNVVLKFAAKLKPDSENEIRNAAIRCIAKIGFNNSYLESLKTKNENLLRLLIEISSVMNDRRCIEEIKDFFWTKNTEIQRLITRHLAKIGQKEDLDFFMDIMSNHNDDHIIKETIVFLGSHAECSKCADEIFRILNHEYDDIKEAALNACISIATPNIKIKFKELYNDPDSTQRLMAIYALYNFDTENIAKEVKVALHDESPKIRQLAIQCLGFTEENLVANLSDILECAHDVDSNVRIAVIEIIAKCNNPEVINHLLYALEDESEWVRIRAVEALGQIKEPSTVPKLVQMLDNSTQMLTLTIIKSLGKMGGNIAFNSLLNMMGQGDHDIQISVENAISIIKSHGENS